MPMSIQGFVMYLILKHIYYDISFYSFVIKQ
jgi:hypothetical protein